MNVRLLIATCTIAAALACASGQASATKVCAFAIPADMIDKIASNKARVGGDFRFKTTSPVTLEDGTLIPTATIGYGVIRSASAAGRRSHDGMLSLEPRYLLLRQVKGVRKIDVTMTPTLPVTWGPNELLVNKAASHIPLPIPGLVMTGVNQVRWGRNITLGPGFTFSVIPIGDLARSPIC